MACSLLTPIQPRIIGYSHIPYCTFEWDIHCKNFIQIIFIKNILSRCSIEKPLQNETRENQVNGKWCLHATERRFNYTHLISIANRSLGVLLIASPPSFKPIQCYRCKRNFIEWKYFFYTKTSTQLKHFHSIFHYIFARLFICFS